MEERRRRGPGERASASACPIDARLPRIKLSSSGGARQLAFRIWNMRRVAYRSRREYCFIVVLVVVGATYVKSDICRESSRRPTAIEFRSSAPISRIAKKRRVLLLRGSPLDRRRTSPLAEARGIFPCPVTDKEGTTNAALNQRRCFTSRRRLSCSSS